MPTFMESCCCRGRRPDGIMPHRHFSRSDLIVRLLRDRTVARFLVAPTGFGKSCLAFEYANMVFSFQHVFWINGRSPCFLRDLDAGTLSGAIERIDGAARLAVFEDIPQLDAERAVRLDGVFDRLLGQKVEVIATCVPSVDAFSLSQRDRVLLSGYDLLLGDEEMAREASEGRMSQDELDAALSAERVACLRWSEEGERVLTAGLKDEELPGSMRLAMLALLAEGSGALDDLRGFLPDELAAEASSLLAQGYPFLGIDERSLAFHAADVGVSALAQAFSGRIDGMVAASVHKDRDALCCHFADVLQAGGSLRRACAFVTAFASKHGAARWAVRSGWAFIERAEPQALFELCEGVLRGAAGATEQLAVLRAWAAFALDDAAVATSFAKRVAYAAGALPVDRLRALVVLARAGTGETRVRAEQALAEAVGGEGAGGVDAEAACAAGAGAAFGEGAASDGSAALARGAVADDVLDWEAVARVTAGFARGAASALGEWCALAGRQGDARGARARRYAPALRNALLLTAAWVLDECASSDADALFTQATPGEGVGSPAHPVLLRVSVSEQIDRVARFVRDHVERACSHAPLSWFSLVAGSALERNAEVDLPVEMPALSPESSFELHQAEVALFAQRDAYRRRRTARRRERQEFELTHPDAYRADAASQASSIARASDAAAHASARTAVPTLRVTLFGGVEAHIGGQLVDPRLLSRRKAKTLLALLVLSHGRETSRDRLSGLLWPDRELEASRRNFYSVWSHLKRTLEVDGRCPYLIRSPTGCRLDVRLVSSDAYDFEALTRSLLFGTSDKEDWEHLYARVSGEFAEELAPYEEHNEVIDALRDRYRVQLVDGLVAASTRLGMQGEARGSLWFAREALGRDKTREDAYVALMEAQIASGQRSAALDTYFSCRRFLTEQLGIDPSPRIVDLYCSVIETEETLV